MVSSPSTPTGPRAWIRLVEIPTSAPNPYRKPSLNRVEELWLTHAASTLRRNSSAVPLFSVATKSEKSVRKSVSKVQSPCPSSCPSSCHRVSQAKATLSTCLSSYIKSWWPGLTGSSAAARNTLAALWISGCCKVLTRDSSTWHAFVCVCVGWGEAGSREQ